MVANRSLHRSFALIALLALVLVAALAANGRVTAGQSAAAAATGPCGPGTAFFGSAPVDTQFVEGSTWQGGTFTTIESDPDHVNVRLVVTDDKVGRFPSTENGATAVIEFTEPIMVTGILWFGNDPEAGESGWSLNGIAGPNTGGAGAQCTSDSFVTDTITIVTDDSGGIDFWFQPPPVAGNEGCTPGYWKNHLDSWASTGFAPTQTLESVFDVPDALGLDNASLHAALSFSGGSGVAGGARILLRAGVAALLNASSPDVDYPRTTAEVIADVNAALASGDRATMIALAAELDADNNGDGGCPLN